MLLNKLIRSLAFLPEKTAALARGPLAIALARRARMARVARFGGMRSRSACDRPQVAAPRRSALLVRAMPSLSGGRRGFGRKVPAVRDHKMRLLELHAGTGSVGNAFKQYGWDVVGLDIVRGHAIKCDILHWDYTTYEPGYFDAVHASPPCTQYSMARTIAKTHMLMKLYLEQYIL